VATTRSRPRGRETARPNVGGTAAEHINKIWAAVIVGAILTIGLLTFTTIGHTIDLAVQHFMLFYAGVLVLIALCTSVGAGLAATDRMFLHPGQRVMMQSVHRAASFGAFTFLIIHVVTEILAQRIDVIDAFIPFLQPFKTFYVGLGTIAGDIIILLVVTGILRKRFVANGKGTWRWRAIHYSNYVSFVFGIWHGLLGGRAGKPYVDWSYGFVIAFVALFLALRVLSNSLRPKEALSSPAIADSAASGTAPLRAAMLAQASSVRKPDTGPMTALGNTAMMLPAAAEPQQPARALELTAGPGSEQDGYHDSGYNDPGYNDAGYGDPAYGDAGYGDSAYGDGGYNGAGYEGSMAPPPVYEPGYEGPPRYQGAPRGATGPMRAVPDSTISGPLPQLGNGQGAGYSSPHTGQLELPAMAAPMTGQLPQVPGAPGGGYGRPASPPRPQLPAAGGPPSGGYPRPATGPMPQAPGPYTGPGSGQMPRVPGAPTGGFPVPPAGPPSGQMPPTGPPSGGFRRPMTDRPRPEAMQPRPGAGYPETQQAPGRPSGGYPRPPAPPMPQAGYGEGPQGSYGGPYNGDPYNGGGYDASGYPPQGYEGGYEAPPQWDVPQDPRQQYRGGDGRR
jgi:hypothetical protein